MTALTTLNHIEPSRHVPLGAERLRDNSAARADQFPDWSAHKFMRGAAKTVAQRLRSAHGTFGRSAVSDKTFAAPRQHNTPNQNLCNGSKAPPRICPGSKRIRRPDSGAPRGRRASMPRTLCDAAELVANPAIPASFHLIERVRVGG